MKRISIPYEEYFDVMDIKIDDKKKRVALARKLEDSFLLFFLLYREAISTGYKSKRFMTEQLRENLINTLSEYVVVDDYIFEHLDEFIDDLYKVTEKNTVGIDKLRILSTEISSGKPFSMEYLNEVESLKQNTTKGKNMAYLLWFLSIDRATALAENESNLIWNYEEFAEAVQSGKTHKQWKTERDNRVRPTHNEIHNETIPINDAFIVGDSLMMFPKDSSLGAGAEEITNCRCWLEYK